MIEYLQRMARYNRWMNRKLFAKVSELPARDIAEDRDAFFGSILGTLNHIMVADLLWLHRFASNKACHEALMPLAEFPTPSLLRDILYKEFSDLSDARNQLDVLILEFADTWTDELLAGMVHYRNMAGGKQQRPLGDLLQHFFNHQTHHRGQATTLLFQAGIDPGPTDLLVMMMEEG
ncbi:MAG: damage-inducible protein DinB [Zetaproteobacteria bacterium CG12_big_fil_rev_8_21_14_0_65_54_13]|nr:MAG: damage-inducible protein DinB [Zetaproteobacteria bacterium CG12_big_fil_rev_8_21_14_0_65_54_13]PIX54380.1 MAG: damage-inducible protein DinB [Zetaproteobacteria bacterium CG_4_10_14_3_um_filter_54_28]PJA30718.1 MAG: damage-inducible protein DinB [Zetaproteobacteria bacterium CG_4_9_14_3_um_filter_54_145]